LPGIQSVAAANDIPYLNQKEERQAFEIFTVARPTKDLAYRGPAQGADVMPGYFDTVGIPLLAGRDFTEADGLDAPPVVVVSQRAAATLWPGQDALGQKVRWGSNMEYDPWMTVVGVVGDTKWQPAETRPGLEVYWSYRQYPTSNTHLLIRTGGDPERFAASVAASIRQTNPGFAIERVKPMATVASESIWQRRLWGFVLGLFALLALSLAALGLYGVLSLLVAQRTREIGIRLAIGASSAQVLFLVIRQGLSLVLAGAVVGLGVAILSGRWLANLLYGISATDATTYTVVPAILLTVSLAAAAIPAWRASRVDPLTALRQE